jgi:hypothetical protein
MPLPMVHLGIAKNIHESGFSLTEVPQYYLGSIAPDAIHMRSNSEKTAKSKTHLIPADKTRIDLDEREYLRFLLDFIEQNQFAAGSDFLWGYCMHVYSDLLWTKTVYTDFMEKYEKDASPIQDKRMAYYNDTDIIDQILFNEIGWRDDVWQQLQIAEGIDLPGLLTAAEMNAWKERTLHWFDSGKSRHKNPVRYMTKTDILIFIDDCSRRILADISSLDPEHTAALFR